MFFIDGKDVSSERFPWPPICFMWYCSVLGLCWLEIKKCKAILCGLLYGSIHVDPVDGYTCQQPCLLYAHVIYVVGLALFLGVMLVLSFFYRSCKYHSYWNFISEWPIWPYIFPYFSFHWWPALHYIFWWHVKVFIVHNVRPNFFWYHAFWYVYVWYHITGENIKKNLHIWFSEETIVFPYFTSNNLSIVGCLNDTFCRVYHKIFSVK